MSEYIGWLDDKPIVKGHSGMGGERYENYIRHLLDTRDLMRQLPAVGDTFMKWPSLFGKGCVWLQTRPYECVVTYVNHKHLWYEVYFKELGFKESYKLPERSRVA